MTTNIQTDSRLLAALRAAAEHRPSAKEVQEQRVSFVYGSLIKDSNMTKAQVKELLAEQEGN